MGDGLFLFSRDLQRLLLMFITGRRFSSTPTRHRGPRCASTCARHHGDAPVGRARMVITVWCPCSGIHDRLLQAERGSTGGGRDHAGHHLLLSFKGKLLPWDQLAIWASGKMRTLRGRGALLGHRAGRALLRLGIPLIMPREDANWSDGISKGFRRRGCLLRFHVLHCVGLPLPSPSDGRARLMGGSEKEGGKERATLGIGSIRK